MAGSHAAALDVGLSAMCEWWLALKWELRLDPDLCVSGGWHIGVWMGCVVGVGFVGVAVFRGCCLLGVLVNLRFVSGDWHIADDVGWMMLWMQVSGGYV